MGSNPLNLGLLLNFSHLLSNLNFEESYNINGNANHKNRNQECRGQISTICSKLQKVKMLS